MRTSWLISLGGLSTGSEALFIRRTTLTSALLRRVARLEEGVLGLAVAGDEVLSGGGGGFLVVSILHAIPTAINTPPFDMYTSHNDCLQDYNPTL